MMTKTLSFVLLMTLVMTAGSLPALAQDQDVLLVHNDMDQHKTRIYVRTSDAPETLGQVEGVGYLCTDPMYPGEYFTIAQLNAGVVFRHDIPNNRDIMWLKTSGFDVNQGGTMTLTFLMNGLTGRHGSLNMEAHSLGSRWQIYTDRNNGSRPFDQAMVKSNKIFGKVVGVSRIDPL